MTPNRTTITAHHVENLEMSPQRGFFCNTSKRANCPNCGKQIPFGSKDCPYCRYIITSLQSVDPLERKWLIWCAIGGAVIHFVLFARFSRAMNQQSDLVLSVIECVMFFAYSFPITLFLLAIPSRIAMDLRVKGRLRQKWFETLLLVLTFTALGWMFYTIIFKVLPGGDLGEH